MLIRRLRPVFLVSLLIALAACSREPDHVAAAPEPPPETIPTPTATLADDRALGDEADGRNWLAFGRTYSEQRFSPLEAINRETVSGLAVDWYLDLPNTRGLVSTPLVADGVRRSGARAPSAATPGTASPTMRSSTCSTSAPATARPGTARCAAPAAARRASPLR